MESSWKRAPFHIGMRTFKTALAVGLAMLTGYAIKSEYPPFLAIGALGAMESSITASLRGARDLTIGNLVGALLGTLFAMIFPLHLALGACLGVILMILICNMWNMRPSTISLACVVFCCCLCDITAQQDFMFGILRFRDTVVGTGIALAVNMLIRPYSGADRTRNSIIKAQHAMLPLLEQRVFDGRIPDLRDLRRSINSLDRDVNVMLDERFNKSLKKSQVAHLRGCQQLLWKMRDSLIGICCIDTMPSPTQENINRMEQLGLIHMPSESILDGKCDHEDTVVFNYYLTIFLDSNEYLSQLIDL